MALDTIPVVLAQAAGPNLLLNLLIILATAGVVAIVMRKLNFEVLPAYLIAGALLGPNAFGAVDDPDSLGAISRLAIIILMFGIGLQLPLSSLRRGFGVMLTVGIVSCVGSIFLAWPVAMLFGLSAPAALAVCMGLSTSSTAVVMRILGDRRELNRMHGRMSFMISSAQDFLVLAMLATIPALATWQALIDKNAAGAASPELASPEAAEAVAASAAPTAERALKTLGVALTRIGGLVLLLVGARYAVPFIVREAAKTRSNEVVIVLSTAIAIAAASATAVLGFSPELGAVCAGLMLASTPFRHQLMGQVGPLRDLFIAVFFTTVGMSLNPSLLLEWWWLVILGTITMATLKAVAIGATCWAVGISPAVTALVALLLAQAGEISLVLLGSAQQQGLFSEAVAGNCIAIVVVSLVVTPWLYSFGRFLSGRANRLLPPPPWIKPSKVRGDDPEESPDAERKRRVVLAGYGLVGRFVAEQLDKMGIGYTIVELNPQTVQRQTNFKKDIIYGDISNPEVLENAGVRTADAVIITIPDDDAVIRACESVRRISPDVFIAVRNNFLSQAMLASQAGANHVTVEEMATAQAMAVAIGKEFGKLVPAAPKVDEVIKDAPAQA